MKTLTAVLCLSVGFAAEARTLNSPVGGDRFGRAVAFAGDRVVVGAPDAQIGVASGVGRVDVFDLGGASIATLGLPPGVAASAGDEFGAAVAGTATRIVVGVPGADVNGKVDAGRALVFDIGGAFVVELAPPNRAAGDGFGFSVAVLGSSFLVGAPGADAGASDAGSVYVFDSQGAFQHKLTRGAAAEADDMLGFAVAGVGATAVIAGAPRSQLSARGAAFLFDVANGAVLNTYQAAAPNGGDRFGAAVAAVGSAVVVGAPVDPTHGDEAGAVHVFAGGDPHADTVVLPATFTPTLFGAALAADGNDVLVGLPLDSGAGPAAGAVVRVDVATGDRLATVRPPVPLVGSMFGAAIASRPGAVAIGAPGAAVVYLAQCGDGVRDPGEECDGADDSACKGHCITATCECGACGDGIVSGTEECDDGNLDACDGCSPTCTVEHGQVCGDGIVRTDCGEQCDDGGTQSGDGCSSDCRFECASSDDCLAHYPPEGSIPVGACRTATCTDGKCSYTLAPTGTSCGDPLGCPLACDGAGDCRATLGNLDCCEVCACCTPLCTTDDDCRSSDPCLGACVDGVCERQPKPAGARCIDDDLCDGDQCDATGTCVKDGTPRECPDDGDPCTVESCDPSKGCTSQPKDCDDGLPCTADRCNPVTGECEHVALPSNGFAAAAFNACYLTACNSPPVFLCDDHNPCTIDVCVDPQTGECSNTPIQNCCQDASDCPEQTCRVGGRCDMCDRCGILSYGEACCSLPVDYRAQCTGGELMTGSCDLDQNQCTADVCTADGCSAGGSLDCNDNNVCTTDSCGPASGCTHKPVTDTRKCGRPCYDDRCGSGSCVPGPYLCDDNNPCTTDACTASGCSNISVPHCCTGDEQCPDTRCQVGGHCVDGTCVWRPVDCAPSNPCEDADCSPLQGCVRTTKNDDESCEPTSALDQCDDGATCQGGACDENRRWCRIDVAKQDGDIAGKSCVAKAKKAVGISVSCLALNDGPLTPGGHKRSRCSAVARTSDGTEVTHLRGHRLDDKGQAQLELHLTSEARKKLCTSGDLALEVVVTLRNRQGKKFTVVRPASVSSSGT